LLPGPRFWVLVFGRSVLDVLFLDSHSWVLVLGSSFLGVFGRFDPRSWILVFRYCACCLRGVSFLAFLFLGVAGTGMSSLGNSGLFASCGRGILGMFRGRVYAGD